MKKHTILYFFISIIICFTFSPSLRLFAQKTNSGNDKNVGMFSLSNEYKGTREMPEPSEYWPVFQSDIPYLDTTVTADIAVFYGAGHTSLVNPVIITDGFDPGDIRPIEGLYEIGNQQNMIDTLRALGNDFILVNFNSGADYIQRNSMLIVSLLDTIQTIMYNNGNLSETPQIVLVGPSMGGLITRHALCYMEQNNMDHHVRNWISFDSPHKGANIPLGLQHWLRFFAEVAESEGAIYGLSKMNSVAAKQMLLYHYSATSNGIAGPNGLRNDFVNEINALGFPQQPRIVAFANGSGYSVKQPYEAGEKVVEYEYSGFLASLTGNIWAVPQQVNTRIFEGLYDTALPLDEVTEDIYVNNTLSYDNAPGGDTPTFAEVAEDDPGYGTIIALHDSHCFIPTISALCIENTNDPEYNISENYENLMTPFDTLYFPYENEEHVEITPQSITGFITEINNFAPVFTCIPETEIETGEEYSLMLTASDVNYWNILSFEPLELPTWLNYNSGTNIISGTPSAVNSGTNHVEVSVSDGLLSTNLEFDINVLNNTSVNSSVSDNILIYPNPVSDIINISFLKENNYNIKIIDISGNTVNEIQTSGLNNEISFRELKSGFYVIVISTDNLTYKARFVKI